MEYLVNIINDLERECKRKVEEYLELEEEVTALRHAIEVLKGNTPHTDVKQPDALYVSVAAQVPKPTGPTCNACGSPMFPGQRTLGNGKVVNMLICNDSGCNNEQFP